MAIEKILKTILIGCVFFYILQLRIPEMHSIQTQIHVFTSAYFPLPINLSVVETCWSAKKYNILI